MVGVNLDGIFETKPARMITIGVHINLDNLALEKMQVNAYVPLWLPILACGFQLLLECTVKVSVMSGLTKTGKVIK